VYSDKQYSREGGSMQSGSIEGSGYSDEHVSLGSYSVYSGSRGESVLPGEEHSQGGGSAHSGSEDSKRYSDKGSSRASQNGSLGVGAPAVDESQSVPREIEAGFDEDVRVGSVGAGRGGSVTGSISPHGEGAGSDHLSSRSGSRGGSVYSNEESTREGDSIYSGSRGGSVYSDGRYSQGSGSFHSGSRGDRDYSDEQGSQAGSSIHSGCRGGRDDQFSHQGGSVYSGSVGSDRFSDHSSVGSVDSHSERLNSSRSLHSGSAPSHQGSHHSRDPSDYSGDSYSQEGSKHSFSVDGQSEGAHVSRQSLHSADSQSDEDTLYLYLSLEGKDLANVEGFFGCSDPFYDVLCSVKEPNGDVAWQPVYRSEQVENNLNPRWKEARIHLDSICGGDMRKPIRISLFDWEEGEKHNPMGFFDTTVDELLSAAGDPAKSFTAMDGGSDYGKLLVLHADVGTFYDPTGSEAAMLHTDAKLHVVLEGKDMANVEGFWGCSDPMFYLEASIENPDGSVAWEKVYTSEHIDDNLNPKWKEAVLGVGALCGGHANKPIRISVVDWEESGKHNTMGFMETTLSDLLKAAGDVSKCLTVAEAGTEYGKLLVLHAHIEKPKKAAAIPRTSIESTETAASPHQGEESGEASVGSGPEEEGLASGGSLDSKGHNLQDGAPGIVESSQSLPAQEEPEGDGEPIAGSVGSVPKDSGDLDGSEHFSAGSRGGSVYSDKQYSREGNSIQSGSMGSERYSDDGSGGSVDSQGNSLHDGAPGGVESSESVASAEVEPGPEGEPIAGSVGSGPEEPGDLDGSEHFSAGSRGGSVYSDEQYSAEGGSVRSGSVGSERYSDDGSCGSVDSGGNSLHDGAPGGVESSESVASAEIEAGPEGEPLAGSVGSGPEEPGDLDGAEHFSAGSRGGSVYSDEQYSAEGGSVRSGSVGSERYSDDGSCRSVDSQGNSLHDGAPGGVESSESVPSDVEPGPEGEPLAGSVGSGHKEPGDLDGSEHFSEGSRGGSVYSDEQYSAEGGSVRSGSVGSERYSDDGSCGSVDSGGNSLHDGAPGGVESSESVASAEIEAGPEGEPLAGSVGSGPEEPGDLDGAEHFSAGSRGGSVYSDEQYSAEGGSVRSGSVGSERYSDDGSCRSVDSQGNSLHDGAPGGVESSESVPSDVEPGPEGEPLAGSVGSGHKEPGDLDGSEHFSAGSRGGSVYSDEQYSAEGGSVRSGSVGSERYSDDGSGGSVDSQGNSLHDGAPGGVESSESVASAEIEAGPEGEPIAGSVGSGHKEPGDLDSSEHFSAGSRGGSVYSDDQYSAEGGSVRSGSVGSERYSDDGSCGSVDSQGNSLHDGAPGGVESSESVASAEIEAGPEGEPIAGSVGSGPEEPGDLDSSEHFSAGSRGGSVYSDEQYSAEGGSVQSGSVGSERYSDDGSGRSVDSQGNSLHDGAPGGVESSESVPSDVEREREGEPLAGSVGSGPEEPGDLDGSEHFSAGSRGGSVYSDEQYSAEGGSVRSGSVGSERYSDDGSCGSVDSGGNSLHDGAPGGVESSESVASAEIEAGPEGEPLAGSVGSGPEEPGDLDGAEHFSAGSRGGSVYSDEQYSAEGGSVQSGSVGSERYSDDGSGRSVDSQGNSLHDGAPGGVESSESVPSDVEPGPEGEPIAGSVGSGHKEPGDLDSSEHFSAGSRGGSVYSDEQYSAEGGSVRSGSVGSERYSDDGSGGSVDSQGNSLHDGAPGGVESSESVASAEIEAGPEGEPIAGSVGSGPEEPGDLDGSEHFSAGSRGGSVYSDEQYSAEGGSVQSGSVGSERYSDDGSCGSVDSQGNSLHDGAPGGVESSESVPSDVEPGPEGEPIAGSVGSGHKEPGDLDSSEHFSAGSRGGSVYSDEQYSAEGGSVRSGSVGSERYSDDGSGGSVDSGGNSLHDGAPGGVESSESVHQLR
jgi:hypothetical protein